MAFVRPAGRFVAQNVGTADGAPLLRGRFPKPVHEFLDDQLRAGHGVVIRRFPPHQVGQDAAASGQNAAGVAAAAYAVAQAGQRTDKVRIFPALHAQNEQRQHLAAAIAFLIQGENGIFQGVHDGLRSGWRNGADVFADVPEKRRSVQYGRRRGRVGQKKAELPPKRPASKFRQGRGACSIFSF